jgi:PAS domain S-box-containing protein
MPSKQFEQEIEKSQERAAEFQRSLRDTSVPGGTLANQAYAELMATIEELRVAEEEMRTQNEELLLTRHRVEAERLRYQELFEFAPDGYLTTDMAGTIQEINQAASRLLNLSVRFLRGKPLSLFIAEPDRSRFYAELHRLDTANGPQEWDFRLKPRKQEEFMASITVGPVLDTQGRQVGLRWLIRDATERKAAEEQRYQTLVQRVTDYAIFMLDEEGSVISWNDGAERITGYTEAEMVGDSFSVLFTPEDVKTGLPDLELKLATETGRAEDTGWRVRKDGSRFWCEGVLTALRDKSGTLVSYAKVMRDLTARRRTEEEQTQRYIREHYIAETFQRAMLPEIPQDYFPGLSVATFYEAALKEAQVGGDFFDAFAVDDDLVALVVGDVSGKGLHAALFASELKSALRLALREYPYPARALSRLNEFVCDTQRLDERQENQFVTMALAVFDPATGEMNVAIAGAEPLLLLRGGQVPEVPVSEALMLGVQPRQEYNAFRVNLAPGDIFLLVTDGITEAHRGSCFLEMAGLATLAISVPRTASLKERGQSILAGAREFAGGSLSDDACLLIAQRLPA